MNKLKIFIATFFNIGRIKIAPGTCSSLITMIILYILNPYLTSPFYIQVISIFVVFFLGIPAAKYAEKHFNSKDPRQCVIDEVVGQMVSLILIPHSLFLYITSFFLFRIFDIFKPFPIRKIEKIHGGFGIMLDDLAAGLYTLGILHLFIWIF